MIRIFLIIILNSFLLFSCSSQRSFKCIKSSKNFKSIDSQDESFELKGTKFLDMGKAGNSYEPKQHKFKTFITISQSRTCDVRFYMDDKLNLMTESPKLYAKIYGKNYSGQDSGFLIDIEARASSSNGKTSYIVNSMKLAE